ncbi:MAG TPA: DUF1810 domain-containing protein [Pseudolabrys sp.]|nr:DUF1810 domain-containing protein [Pseudolabrys sp.]
MTDPDLIRFLYAQDQIYAQVAAELTKGRKQTHWMWFVFPQLLGLGRSAMAQHYAIHGLNQARRYLDDPVLGARLRQVVNLMIHQKGKSALEILGSPDDLKFRSCLTLFRQAAFDNADLALFNKALDQFYRGDPDERTLELLGPKI